MRHDGPVLALAMNDDVVVSAGSDGSVLLYDRAMKLERALVEDAKVPFNALAMRGDDIVGAGKDLVVWSRAGKTLAKAKLPAVATAVNVRGDVVYVLSGGNVLSFEGPKLTPKGSWRHAKGVASELDVDDTHERALVLRDNKEIELLDLKKKKSLAQWTRKKKKVEAVSARFGATKKGPAPVLCVSDDEMRICRVKDTTGRITGEVLWLDSYSNGPLVADRSRNVMAIGGNAEDIEVIDVAGQRTIFYLDPNITAADEKALAGMKRIPKFAQIAPGFFVRHGSTKAPPEPGTLSAVAVADGGTAVGGGYVSGDVVVAETKTGRTVSTHRGVLQEARCMEMIALGWSDLAGCAELGDEIWLLRKDRKFFVADLGKKTLREAFDAQVPGDSEVGGELEIDAEGITCVNRSRVLRWSRKDGSLLLDRALPATKGATLLDKKILYLPLDSLGHEGFDIVALDLATGDTKVLVHFDRDDTRFARGNDPQGWVSFGRVGTQAMLNIWAGKGLTVAQTFAFDLETGTVGQKLPWAATATGTLLAKAEPRERVTVTDLSTGQIVIEHAFREDEGHITTPSYDPVSRNLAAFTSGTGVVVWSPDGRRLDLRGHRDAHAAWVGSHAVLVKDRFATRLWDID